MSKKSIFLYFFLLLKLVLPLLLIDAAYELHRDEYLHLDQAKHLSWGFYSVLPLTSILSWLILQLGNNAFLVKFFPALFGALTLLVVWKTIELLRGNLFALSLGAISIIFSAITRINILFQPNSLDILCWTLFYFTIAKYIRSEKIIWLLYASTVFALGFYNKYNIVFLILGILPAIILSHHRKVFKNPSFSTIILIALLLISPNIIWQFYCKLPVIHHLKTLIEKQLILVNRFDFLKEQLLFFIGSIFILIAAFISFFTYAPFHRYRMFFWSFIFTLLLFIIFRAKGYYAIGLYPILLAFGSVFLEKISTKGWKYKLRPLAIAIPILTFIPLFKIAFPIQPPANMQQNIKNFGDIGLLRWEDGKTHTLPQDFADMLGWRELSEKVDSAGTIINDATNTLVLCDNYGQAGAINYYTKYKNIPAFCMEGDYYTWFLQHDKEIKNIVLVKTADAEINLENEKLFFKTIVPFGKVENIYAREQGTSIYILKDITSSKLLKDYLIIENKPH